MFAEGFEELEGAASGYKGNGLVLLDEVRMARWQASTSTVPSSGSR
jgi:hypothetical protein